MSVETFHEGRVTLHHGDCLNVIRTLPDCSIDSIVTDPPYGIVFMGKQWDKKENTAFAVEFWAECLRVLKPGGHVLAFSATRTYHRLAVAIEDAGFEIRDMVGWLYGSGFPKSHDVSKAIDKAAGAEREIVSQVRVKGGGTEHINRKNADTFAYRPDGYQKGENVLDVTAPATPEAVQWQGWGTALKPAQEPICMARKPLAGTVAANVLEHGTGGLNIDGCRVGTEGARNNGRKVDSKIYGKMGAIERVDYGKGRFPANIIHDGSEEVVGLFPESKGQQGDVRGSEPSGVTDQIYGKFQGRVSSAKRNDSGSAARFFYAAKAGKTDRVGSKHPTVKPVNLMQYLVRLVTPPGGTVLDPFAGTGTTGEAAWREGFNAVLIEREDEYCADIAERMRLSVLSPKERKAEIAERRNLGTVAAPLFDDIGEMEGQKK